MKTKLLSGVLTPLLITGGLSVCAQIVDRAQLPAVAADAVREAKVFLNQLPAAVQNTVRAQLGNVPVPPVEMITANGQTSYALPSRWNEAPVDLWLDPAGNVLAVSPPRVLLSSPVRINPNDLPAPVQGTIRTFVPGAPLASVDRGTINDRPVYDIVCRPSSRNVELRIADDGSLVRDTVNDRFLAETGRMSREGLAAIAPPRVPISDLVPISFNQLPLAVLSTLQSYAGSDYIEKLQRGVAQGRTFYDALFQHAGRPVPLRIAEDGTLVPDRVNLRFLAQSNAPVSTPALGRAPSWQSGIGAGSGTFPPR